MVTPSQNPPWSSTLTNLPAPNRRSTTLKPNFNHRPTTRGDLLAASLRRGFISSRVLHSRYATSSLSEFLGPVAPDRYRSLPHRSTAAAKALTAVAMRKGLKEVHRLESFRRSGSLKLGLTQFRDDDPEDDEACWFDGVAAAFLGCRLGPAIEHTLESCKTWSLGDNPAPSLRTAHLPLEAHCVEMTGGADYSHSIAPATMPARTSAELIDVNGAKASFAEEHPAVLQSHESPSPDVVLVDKVDQVHSAEPMPVEIPRDEAMRTTNDGVQGLNDSSPGGDPDGTLRDAGAQLPPLDGGTLDTADTFEGAHRRQDVSGPTKLGENAVVVRPILFADPSSEKLSFDIDIVEKTPTSPAPRAIKAQPASFDNSFLHVPEPQLLKELVQGATTGGEAIGNGEVNHVQLEPIVSIDVKQDHTETIEAPCNVRQDAPATLLQEMLEDMNGERDHLGEAPMDVVNGDTANEKDKDHGLSHASKQKRLRKRKLSTHAVHDKNVLEERRDRMKAAVMETLQGEAESKKKVVRSGVPGLNGQRSPRAPRNREFQRRSSRRTRRVTARTIDSSSSESNEIDDDGDEEFIPLEARGAPPPLPQRTVSNSLPVNSPDGPSNGKDLISPRKRPEVVSREVAGSRAKPVIPRKPDALIRDETGAIIVRKPTQTVAVMENMRDSWEAEIRRIERLVNISDDASPELSSAEDESDLEPFDGLPLVHRLVQSCAQDNRDLLNGEPFDEHGEMMRFYKETRNEPAYAPHAISPGTQFVEESWRRSSHSLLDADLNTEAGARLDNDNLGEGNMMMATMAASAEAQVKAPIGSSGSKVESCEASSGKSESSEEEGAREDGVSRKVQVKAKAIRAKELQSRVCGDLLSSMEPEARRRVLRWAEKDYSWFDDGADMMELVGSKTSRPCSHCDSLDGCAELRCEESILLKLWTNMKWRKVRRMRHRVRGSSA